MIKAIIFLPKGKITNMETFAINIVKKYQEYKNKEISKEYAVTYLSDLLNALDKVKVKKLYKVLNEKVEFYLYFRNLLQDLNIFNFILDVLDKINHETHFSSDIYESIANEMKNITNVDLSNNIAYVNINNILFVFVDVNEDFDTTELKYIMSDLYNYLYKNYFKDAINNKLNPTNDLLIKLHNKFIDYLSVSKFLN